MEEENESVVWNTRTTMTLTHPSRTAQTNRVQRRMKYLKGIFLPGSGPSKNLQAISSVLSQILKEMPVFKIIAGNKRGLPESLRGDWIVVVYKNQCNPQRLPKQFLGVAVINLNTQEYAQIVRREKCP